MKKKIILMFVAGILALTAVIGGSLAAFSGKTEDGKAEVTTKQLGATFTEIIDEENVPLGENGEAIIRKMAKVPGEDIQSPVAIVNNVSDGYDLYAKVTVNKSWYDEEGKNFELDPSKIEVNTIDSSDWIIKENADQEQVIFIYKKPLKANEVTTSNFIDSISIAPDIGNEYANHEVVLEMTMDAVQAANAQDGAILSAWGLNVEIDGNGEIISILE